MTYRFLLLCLVMVGCHHSNPNDSLALIQIQDRNNLTETISNPDRLTVYGTIDFCSSQPYKKVLRVFKSNGKNCSKITTYHPNGMVWQYLEAEEMRAHGAYREWFANGQLKIEATVIGGNADVTPGSQENWLFDSTSQVWDEQGNLVAQIPYQKGVLEGMSLYFYPSGQVEREIPFIRNDMDGEATEFSPNGTVRSKIHYKKGVKDGISLGFFNDKKLAWEEDFSDGMIRTGKYYNPQGEPVSQIEGGGGFQAICDEEGSVTLTEFRVGKPEGLVQKFTPAKELHRSFHVKNGKKQGEEIEFYLSPHKPKLSITWSESTIHGCVKTWYDNGQLQSQREYSRNQRSGPALAWYRDGSLMMWEEYEEEKLLSGQYFKIHKPEPVSTVTNGNGLATIYDETGSFLRKVTYSKGRPIDPDN